MFARQLGKVLQRKGMHHLQSSICDLIPLENEPPDPALVPDADFLFATWWETAEWIRDWPNSKGHKCHFIRHHEVFVTESDRARNVYRLPYSRFVISSWLQRVMAEQYHDIDVPIISNGVDRTQFAGVLRDKNADPVIGFLYGYAWKEPDFALEVIEKLQERYSTLRVISFGAKRMLRRHRKMIKNLEYHCYPDQNVIPRLYGSVDCWFVPSSSEGFGMPGLEAAACHCPVVSTRCGGPEDYVMDGVNGYLVDVGSTEQMVNAISCVLELDNTKWQAMSSHSKHIADQFTWDASAEKLERALLELRDANHGVHHANGQRQE